MTKDQTSRFPFTAFPDGIFAVGFSHEVKAKQIIPIFFMGKKLIVFRTENGDLAALDAYCSHLGADLSAGKIKGEYIQCPFHGLKFNKQGACSTKDCLGNLAYQQQSWRIFENYGLIFIAHGSEQVTQTIRFPNWQTEEWSKPTFHCFKVKSHPQEILENSVDLLHFFQVHHYLQVENVQAIQFNGPEFIVGYHLQRSEGLFSWWRKTKTPIELTIHAYGLGLSCADIILPSYGLQAKQLVLPTPIDGDTIHIRTLTSFKIPNWIMPLFLKRILIHYINLIAVQGFLKDFLPDIQIWEQKKYIEHPHYLNQDGDFAGYRQWAKQFYRHFDAVHFLNQPNKLNSCLK